MPRVLYIACSAYSGSTFLSFLLNTHSRVVTVGHSMGWSFDPDEEFHCSCGRLLQECPFFARIGDDFRAAGLAFEARDFGTAYRLVAADRPNRWLTTNLPVVDHGGLERLRDRLVWAVPGYRSRLRVQDRANEVFVVSALRQRHAEVFVDNSHDPHRLRHLRRIPSLRLQAVHLVRDPRGVALSNRTKKGWDVATTTRMWLRRQSIIARVAAEYAETRRIYYEELCADVDAALRELHPFMGLDFEPFQGDFKAGEHHILGNMMRLQGGKVNVDLKWRRELSSADLELIARTFRDWARSRPSDPAVEIARHYLDGDDG